MKPPQYDYLLPPEECKRVLSVLHPGTIIDPCGHPAQHLEADTVFYGMSPDDDGLLVDWSDHNAAFLHIHHGDRRPNWDGLAKENESWVRPDWPWYPFSKWLAKARIEAQKGVDVLVLAVASTDRSWFHQYLPSVTSCCFLEQRVHCDIPAPPDLYIEGAPNMKGPQPIAAHMFWLWTKSKETADRFYEAYKSRGVIIEPNPVE